MQAVRSRGAAGAAKPDRAAGGGGGVPVLHLLPALPLRARAISLPPEPSAPAKRPASAEHLHGRGETPAPPRGCTDSGDTSRGSDGAGSVFRPPSRPCLPLPRRTPPPGVSTADQQTGEQSVLLALLARRRPPHLPRTGAAGEGTGGRRVPPADACQTARGRSGEREESGRRSRGRCGGGAVAVGARRGAGKAPRSPRRA
mmetsp:Transcript_62905/g.149952  ORF Transcript_62905/g.149952 Transcript_62905/m.149952 type:complete len:200 (+) Transcript_62905:142-741(+)